MKSKKTATPRDSRLNAAIQALDSKKADQITVLDLGNLSTVARYFVIATGTSMTHLNALRKSLEDLWKEEYSQRLPAEARPGSNWQVLDAEHILIHLFTAEERRRYNLESLWGDAKQIQVGA